MTKARVALVTGSTSGIGLSVARALAEAGHHIYLHGLGDANQIHALKESLSAEFGVRVEHGAQDLSKPESAADMVRAAAAALGAVDVLVNNAGIQHVAAVEDFPLEKWNAVLNINLTSAFVATQTALPLMKKSGFGRIINVASAHGLVASVQKAAYVASKHGIVGLTKVVALETARTGITCNAICPGWVKTPLVEKQIEARAADQGISYQEAADRLVSEKQPTGRFVEPEQIGALTVFLAGPQGSTMTGSILSIDGGWTAQ